MAGSERGGESDQEKKGNRDQERQLLEFIEVIMDYIARKKEGDAADDKGEFYVFPENDDRFAIENIKDGPQEDQEIEACLVVDEKDDE